MCFALKGKLELNLKSLEYEFICVFILHVVVIFFYVVLKSDEI